MALRWEESGVDTEHAFLGSTRLFTLLHPTRTDNGHFVLSSDLPGQAAGRLVVQQFASVEAAKQRAGSFLLGWLSGYMAEAQRPPAPPLKVDDIPRQTTGQTPDRRSDKRPFVCRTCTGHSDGQTDKPTDKPTDTGQSGADT